MRVTFSTAYGLWFKCPMAHYLYTKEGGRGIVNTEENMHTEFGTACHDSVEGLSIGASLDEGLSTIAERTQSIEGTTLDGEPRSLELNWLGQGLVRSFHRYWLDNLLAVYDIEAVEKELSVPITDELIWLTTPDLHLRRKQDDAHFNGNIKTMGYVKDVVSSFEFSVQMLMEAHAIKLKKGLDTGGTIVLSLSKGQKGKANKRDKEQGKEGYRLESPFTYVWWKKGTYSFQWSAGSEKIGVWEFNKTPEEWFNKLPEELAAAQIFISEPIRHSSVMNLESVMRDIQLVEALCNAEFKPKAYDSCNNFATYRRPCDYKLWCHGTPQERESNFQLRRPHHPIERKMLDTQVESVVQ